MHEAEEAMSETRELTLKERQRLRLSLYLAIAGVALYAVTFLLTLVPHDIFQSDIMGIPLFYALLFAVVSAVLAFPIARKRPICLLWSIGVPLVLFVGPVLFVVGTAPFR